MSNEDSTSNQDGWFKRAGKFIWRWAPHAASLLGTAGLTVGAILLGSDDYTALTKKALIWGWSLVGGGFVFLVFATFTHGNRERQRTKLEESLLNAETRAANAEERVAALQRALQEGLRSRLLHTRDDLEIAPGTEFRISLYSHSTTRRQLVRRARFSSNHAFEDVRDGRATIPDDTGLVGEALTKQRVSIYTVSTPRVPGGTRPAWENWMVTHGFVTPAVAADLRMETYFYMFAPIQDPAQGRTIGMLVVEFAKANGTPSQAKLKNSMSQRERDLAVALAAVERELEHTAPEGPGQTTDRKGGPQT
ncbi:hypothetical protein [Nocardioides sp.]|uniref:hypothetical protein n=1 Tax=Nocardioides sp. TaxID=35761 RepID=UPI00261BBEAA|nr:hypothetical protein [Nocardioides sp.]